MALTNTLFTGLSGLVVNQAELNVVGNNIANANTTAFKSSTIQFSPQFYVTDSTGAPATGTFGGTNPSQEGLGASVGSITQNFTPGALQSTGISSNLAIDGNGFFVVNNSSAGQLYTRNGDFDLNNNDQLVDSSGNFVQGYGVDANFNIVPGTLQNITLPLGQETVAQATANATLSGTLDTAGDVSTTGTVLTTNSINGAGLQDNGTAGPTVTNSSLLVNLSDFGTAGATVFSSGQVLTAAGTQGVTDSAAGRSLGTQTFTITSTSTVSDLENFLTGYLNINTSPPAADPGPAPGAAIVDDAGGGQDLTFTGNVGTANNLSLTLTDATGASPLTFGTTDATGDSQFTPISAFDSLGNPVTLNVVTSLISVPATGGTVWEFNVTSPDNQGPTPVLGSGTLTFDGAGNLTAVTGNTITLDRAGTGAKPSQTIKLDFSGVQALGPSSNPAVITSTADGTAPGTLTNYSIGTDGVIIGTFNNGLNKTIGQIALANFNNPNGLNDLGSSLYQAGSDSGTAIVTTPGAQGTGVIRAGELEQSNVDLSTEFINLIIASTGYSASSRVISTSDQLLTALLQSQG